MRARRKTNERLKDENARLRRYITGMEKRFEKSKVGDKAEFDEDAKETEK